MCVCVCIGRKSPGLLRQGVIILHDKARRTCDLIRHYGREVMVQPPYDPDLASSDFHLSRSIWLASDSSSRLYPGDEALCPVMTRLDDCHSLSNVLVTTQIPQPHRWESLPTFQCRGSCFNYHGLSVHCGSRWLITFHQGDKLRQIFLP